MRLTVTPVFGGTGVLRPLVAAALCVFLTTTLLACSGGGEDAASDERVLELEEQIRTLEASLETLAEDTEALKRDIAALRAEQAVRAEARDGAAGEQEQLADIESRLVEIEAALSRLEAVVPTLEQLAQDKDEQESPAEGSVLGRTVRLAQDAGGEIVYLDHPGRGDRSVLVLPREFVDGETPLIVSLHGFGGDSASHTAFLPLHERVNSHGFALLLPNGILNDAGYRFWNPTDRCCEAGKTGEDDVAYLTELVALARTVRDFGPVYFFGYSNGGFMSYHMGCKGLPGLRAVASLAGTSYVEDTSCEGAPPVSVLHIHGTADSVIQFEGDEQERNPAGDREPAFYAGAREMVTRWSQRAGCDWPEDLQPHATIDFDQWVSGAETRAYRLESGCAEGITIELWEGEGSSHFPGYGDAFVDALVDWLLSR
ncbi:MAG: hypothetical protein OXG61_01360 [Chloroflexi bacterium]|nr:hypothetical protein [Chloroflexota bacterium]